MDCDVAVLGGGPGRLHGRHPRRTARREGRLHRDGAGARRHVPPRRLHPDQGVGADRVALKEAEESFAKLGVNVGETSLDFAASNAWKSSVVDQMTGGVAGLFKANGVEWVKGKGTFTDANTIAVEGGENVTFKSAIVATGSSPLRPPIPGLDSPLCVDSTGLLAQEWSRSGWSSSAAASSAASSPRSSAASAAR